MDMIYYSGKAFADRIKREVELEVNKLSDNIRENIQHLLKCLVFV